MPLTMRQHEANLRQPAFCELLPIRDYLDNVIVRSNGALVAGYDLGGINSYYHSDETRNQTKFSLEALVRSLTERSMRMQVRFEVVEGLGELPAHYQGPAPLGQSSGAEPRPRPACGVEAKGAVGLLSHADAARVFLLGSAYSSRGYRDRRREETGQDDRRLERFSREMHPACAPGTRRPGFGVRIHAEGRGTDSQRYGHDRTAADR